MQVKTYVEFLIKDSINQSKFKGINTGLVFKYLREQYLQKIKKNIGFTEKDLR